MPSWRALFLDVAIVLKLIRCACMQPLPGVSNSWWWIRVSANMWRQQSCVHNPMRRKLLSESLTWTKTRCLHKEQFASVTSRLDHHGRRPWPQQQLRTTTVHWIQSWRLLRLYGVLVWSGRVFQRARLKPTPNQRGNSWKVNYKTKARERERERDLLHVSMSEVGQDCWWVQSPGLTWGIYSSRHICLLPLWQVLMEFNVDLKLLKCRG